jgi:TonB family protein
MRRKMKTFSFAIATLFTLATLAVAALLNDTSAVRNRPSSAAAAMTVKKTKEKQKIRKRPIRREKKLKNIKQAPRVSPNLHIAVDIPLEMPEVETLHTQALEEVEAQPPVPNVTNPAPEYPYEARREGVQGRVVAMVLVDEYGFVAKVRISSSAPPEVFDGSVRTALREWRFSPARLRGEPVVQWVEIPFNFVL